MNFAKRVLGLPPSATLAVAARANALRRAGITITGFSNRPGTPPEAVRAAKSALDEPWSSTYTDAAGLPELRQAIAEKTTRVNGFRADPDFEILVTVGAKQAMFMAIMSLVNPDDEVLIPDPAWVSYDSCVTLAGGRVVRFPLREENDFQPDVGRIRKLITARTRLIILNSPHNPTGAVFSQALLKEIATVVREYDLLVLSDEVYEHYIYDGSAHVSIGAFPEMRDRTVTISSTSKIFNMFGWRVGWAIAHADVIDRMGSIHQHIAACAPSFAQAGVIAALRLGPEVIAERVRQYEPARHILIDGLNALPGISCHKPAGTYFAFPNVKQLGKRSAELARLLLETGAIQSTAGSAFGPGGEGHLRLLFACTRDDAIEGIDRLKNALERIRP